MSTPQHPELPTTPLPDLAPSAAPTQAFPRPPAAPTGAAAPYGAPNGYAAQPYRQPVPASTATTLAQTNTFALLAIILAFIAPVAAIVFGHMGLSQIKRTGDAGRGIALTGLIIGYAYFVLVALFVVLYVGFVITMIASLGAAFSGFDSGYDPYSY